MTSARKTVRKTAASLALAAAVSLTASNTAFGAACLQSAEAAAVNARMMQTELMVAALTCQKRGEYNHFVKQFESELVGHGRKLKATFKRMYGASSESQLNRFVTRLANEASLRSLQSADYCTRVDGLFAGTFATKPGKLATLASTMPFINEHGLAYCEEEERVAQVTK